MILTKEKLSATIKASLNVIFTFAGVGSVSYGAWLIYPPSAYVVAGIASFYMGLPDK